MTRFQPRPVRSISVLMPTWQGEEFLERVLARLSEQSVDLPFDVTVVDSGSTDRTLEILEAWRGRLGVPFRILHIHPSAFDHGDTRNLLAAESSGDLLVFLTQDAIPSGRDWLQRLARNFDDPRVAAAYCRNVPREDADLLTRVFSENDPGYAPGRREVRLPGPADYARMDPHERRLLYNFNDVASAIRRDLWELHPFPRTEFGEDVLIARALLEAGYTVVYDDAATVEHSHDYGPDEAMARARIDGKFNAEWLDRVCIASRADADALTERQLVRDRAALEAAGFSGAALERELARARELRRATFLGLYEGGLSKRRFPPTRLVERTKKRILYVVHSFPPETWAGTEVYTLGLALEMQRRGHEVAVLTRVRATRRVEDGGPPDFTIAESSLQGLPVWHMTNSIQHARMRESYEQPKVEGAFREVLLRYEPDVVHFQHLIHLSTGLPRVCRELGIPSLVTVNDFWAVCARVQLIRPDGVRCEENKGLGCLVCVKDKDLAYVEPARKLLPLLAPFVRAAGAVAGVLGSRRGVDLARDYADIASRQAVTCGGYANCDLAIAPSRFMREKLLQTGHFEPRRVLYSDYGTLMDNIRPIDRAPDPEGRIRLGYVGSLLWYKGVDVLIRAMQRLRGRKITLDVFGDFKPESEPHHRELAALAAECGGSVVFHGRFDNDRIADVYERFDALVVPSTWFENSPITIHESFLFRTPVITSDIGGMAELVRDGVDGLHFKVGDSEDLARVLQRLEDEPDLLERLSQFRHVKTMGEDAREMEARYRALCCVVRTGRPLILLDRVGIATTARGGPVEQQGSEHALLRRGGAWVEYDARTLGTGAVVVTVDVPVIGSETGVELGGTLSFDGAPFGAIDAFTATGKDEVRSFRFETRLAERPSRLRIDTRSAGREVELRLARVRVEPMSPVEG